MNHPYQGRIFHDSPNIWKSASDGDDRKVKACVELDGTDVNLANMEGTTALHIAAGLGNIKLVSYLIFVGADRFSRDCNGLTPIHCAARSGHLAIIKLLLEVDNSFSEDFDMKTYDGWTILHFACRDGHESLFEYIMDVVRQTADMDFGVLVDLEARTTDGRTPLLVAAQNGHSKIVETLIQSKADVGATCWPQCYGGMHLAALGGHTEVLIMLALAGQNVDMKSDGRYTPLMLAASEGHAKACTMLLEAAADVSLLSEDQMSALDLACRNRHADVIVALQDEFAERGLVAYVNVLGDAAAADKTHLKMKVKRGEEASELDSLDWSEVEAKCPAVASCEEELEEAVPGCGRFTRLVFVAAHQSEGAQLLVPRNGPLVAHLLAEGHAFLEQCAWGPTGTGARHRVGAVMGQGRRWERTAAALLKGLGETQRAIDEVQTLTAALDASLLRH